MNFIRFDGTIRGYVAITPRHLDPIGPSDRDGPVEFPQDRCDFGGQKCLSWSIRWIGASQFVHDRTYQEVKELEAWKWTWLKAVIDKVIDPLLGRSEDQPWNLGPELPLTSRGVAV